MFFFTVICLTFNLEVALFLRRLIFFFNTEGNNNGFDVCDLAVERLVLLEICCFDDDVVADRVEIRRGDNDERCVV